MSKIKRVSGGHALVALLVLTPIALAPMFFLQPKAKDDFLAKLPETPLEQVPIELRGVGIDEKIGARLPLGLTFRNEIGQEVELGSYFRTGLPVILTMNYSDCPMLCHVQLNKFVETMSEGKIYPGQGFSIVTVSIDPNESPGKARVAKRNYLRELEVPSNEWHFLHSKNEESIKALAQAVGFNYRFDPIKKDYAHSSALILCSAQGVVSQYYQGIDYKPDELRRRIAETAQGKQVASNVDEDNPFNCKLYDGSKPYAAFAGRMMKVVGTILAVLLILTLTILWMIPDRRPEVLPPLQGVNQA